MLTEKQRKVNKRKQMEEIDKGGMEEDNVMKPSR